MENAAQPALEKWGESARGGFQIVPDILFKKQTELGLTSMDMLVLLNITMHWWYPEQRPFPRVSTLASRIGVEARTIQRSLRKMQDLKLVERVDEKGEDGIERTVCDLSGLIKRLDKYVVTDADYLVRTAERPKAVMRVKKSRKRYKEIASKDA